MSSILEDRAMDASDQIVKSQLGDQLKLEEFKILRGEIELRSSEGRTMERNESITMIVALAAYLRGIETAHMGGKGWEAYLECRRTKRTNRMISPWYTFFWIVIIVGPLAIGLLRHLGYDRWMLALTAAASILVGVIVYKVLPKEVQQNVSCCTAPREAADTLS
jgi:hypothetical protein